ncbi:hypothetical protein NHQ30_003408 [Ciborinia camelliae]|nr:hypothetical protein NHQ30_003408 [Ciborinia camelliae]
MKITHTTYNEVRGGVSTPNPHPTPPHMSPAPEFLTTPAAFRFSPTRQRSSSPITNPLRNTTRRIKRYLKMHVRFHVRFRSRPGSQRFSRSRYGRSIKYPPGEMHPPTVPTQVGKYHSGSVRGSLSSRGGEGERVLVVKGSQAHERGLEQRYKHVRGKKRPSYLKPREEGRKSGGEWGLEQGVGGLDFEAYMKQQQGLERDFGKGYNGGISPPSPPNNSPPRHNSPPKGNSSPRNISPPNHSLVPREDWSGSRKIKDGTSFEQSMTPMDFDTYMKQQRALARDFGKGYGYGGNSPSPPNSPPRSSPPRISPNYSPKSIPIHASSNVSSRSSSPHASPNHSAIAIPVQAGRVSETGTGTTGTGTTSLGDSVRFSDVQWSSVGSAGSATGTTGTTDSGVYAESSRGRGTGAGMALGIHKAAPGQRKLRRKGNFEERDQSPVTTPASSRSQTMSKDEESTSHAKKGKGIQRESKEEKTTIEQLEMMRKAMWNGKLEKVVPPSHDMPKHTDVLHPSTPNSTSTRNSKGKGKGKVSEGRASPIQKLKGYMGHGVEVVDDYLEKKTTSKTGSKLPSPFEYLLYPSYDGKGKGKSERNSTESRAKSKGKGKAKEEEDSDEELWGCVGEKNNESGILMASPPEDPGKENRDVGDEVEPPKTRKESNGEESWTVHRENLCKLCRKRGPSGPRGLCRACEQNLLNTKAWEESNANLSDESDIPPTPPLKDRNIASIREMLATTPPNYCADANYRPPLPAKDSIHVSKVENSRPQIVNPLPVRQESQYLVYGGMGDSPRDIEIGFPDWQTHSLEIEGAKTAEMVKRWSENYRVKDVKGGAEEKEEENEKGHSPRDSTFYDFWADILKEDRRAETPKMEDRKPRA